LEGAHSAGREQRLCGVRAPIKNRYLNLGTVHEEAQAYLHSSSAPSDDVWRSGVGHSMHRRGSAGRPATAPQGDPEQMSTANHGRLQEDTHSSPRERGGRSPLDLYAEVTALQRAHPRRNTRCIETSGQWLTPCGTKPGGSTATRMPRGGVKGGEHPPRALQPA